MEETITVAHCNDCSGGYMMKNALTMFHDVYLLIVQLSG